MPAALAAVAIATILCYHEVDPPGAPSHETIPRATAAADTRAERLRYTATVDAFREQLDYLEQHHYHVIPLADLVNALRGRVRLPPRAVVITVDDGWECAYTEVYPELHRRRMPWTLFLYPEIVGRGAHAVTWDQVEEMARGGVDVESHTYTHPFLTKVDDLVHELADSRNEIRARTCAPVRLLSYPYGDYDKDVVAASLQEGYEAAVTTSRARITRDTSPMALPRYLIHNDTTIEEFRGFLLPY